jgi:hypothetical protein
MLPLVVRYSLIKLKLLLFVCFIITYHKRQWLSSDEQTVLLIHLRKNFSKENGKDTGLFSIVDQHLCIWSFCVSLCLLSPLIRLVCIKIFARKKIEQWKLFAVTLTWRTL